MSTSFAYSFFSSWAQSLQLLLPRHLKTFVLLTVSTLKKVYTSLFCSAWWVLIFYVLVAWWYPASRLMLIGKYLLMFVLIAASRSSVGLKTPSYYIEKMMSYFPLYALFALFMKLVSGFLLTQLALSAYPFIIKAPIDLYVLVCGFFLLDSPFLYDALVRVPFNGFKMIMYNLPLFVLVSGVMSLARFGIYRFGTGLLGYTASSALLTAIVDCGLFVAFASIATAIISTIYIKRLYEQSSLYLY